jgi:hypothetical protein
MVEFRKKTLAPVLGIPVAFMLALNQMKLPPLIGVALKLDAMAVWAMHLGPENVDASSVPAALKAMRAARMARMFPLSVFDISFPVVSCSSSAVWVLTGKWNNIVFPQRQAVIDRHRSLFVSPVSPESLGREVALMRPISARSVGAVR